MHHPHPLGQLRRRFIGKGNLELHRAPLEVGQGALQRHLPPAEQAHVVAHVLQLPQVVGGHQHRGPPLGHIPHEQRPHLAAHHRIQAVHRLVQQQVIRPAAQRQPEGGLLLHPLGQPADGPLFVHGGECLPQLLIAPHVEGGIDPFVELHHVPGGGGGEVVQLVGYARHALFHRRVFIDGRALQQDLAAVLAIGPGDVAQDGGFARPVGPHQPVNGPPGHRHGQPVQGVEAAEALDHVFHFNHCVSSFPSSMHRLAISARPIPK